MTSVCPEANTELHPKKIPGQFGGFCLEKTSVVFNRKTTEFYVFIDLIYSLTFLLSLRRIT